MAVNLTNMRPNIKVEIQNNLAEQMEVDAELHENEEGEIIEDTDLPSADIETTRTATTEIFSKGIFTTGINIFDKQVQEKLHERAKRFALKPNEINIFTDDDLLQLYNSLGINSNNESNVRFDSVHLLGVENLTTDDLCEYFIKYAPTSVEWISENSCNIVWVDKISAARAIHYISKVVKGMPVREAFVKEFDLIVDEDDAEKSILLKNANREIELKIDEDVLNNDKNIIYKNAADISEITIPIPPGYWRLGEKHPKSKCLLIRFALKTDKKPFKEEKFKNFNKKHNALHSKRTETRGIFDRNKELQNDKNPWGTLARNWDEDAKFREREPIVPVEEPKIEVKNPSLQVRLGKKNHEEEEKKEKKSKVPRMRMYADDEDEKVKRKKLLQTLKKQTELLEQNSHNSNDLRNILGIGYRRQTAIPNPLLEDSDQIDLGLRLKNRSKKMVFTVERNLDEITKYMEQEVVKPDARSFLDKHREGRTSVRHRFRSRSPEARRRSPIRSRRSPEYRRSRSPIHQRRRERYRNEDKYSDVPSKLRSKVAVVIKKQRPLTVASTVWSRVKEPSNSESEESSESSSESSSSSSESSESEEESNESQNSRSPHRPGFSHRVKSRPKESLTKIPLKIEISNDHFKNK